MENKEILEFNIANMHKMRNYSTKIDTNPETILEKLMYLNIYDANPLKSICADKIKEHEYCKSILGKDICIPILKVYNNINEINFEELPNLFVMKCNHGYAMNIICLDKSKLNINDVLNKLNKWLNTDFTFSAGFESHYHWIDRKIYVEKYMNDGHKDLIDYKFLCFNGHPTFCQVIGGRNESTRHLNYYDMDFKFIDICRKDFKNNKNIKDEKPKKFELMKEYAYKLSKDFKFVRVDFYEINNEVYLGELTFTPGAMLFTYVNPKDNIEIGKLLEI